MGSCEGFCGETACPKAEAAARTSPRRSATKALRMARPKDFVTLSASFGRRCGPNPTVSSSFETSATTQISSACPHCFFALEELFSLFRAMPDQDVAPSGHKVVSMEYLSVKLPCSIPSLLTAVFTIVWPAYLAPMLQLRNDSGFFSQSQHHHFVSSAVERVIELERCRACQPARAPYTEWAPPAHNWV